MPYNKEQEKEKVCRESLAVVDSYRGLNNLSMTSKAKIKADPKISMRRLPSDMKLATETVGRAFKAVINAQILSTLMYLLLEDITSKSFSKKKIYNRVKWNVEVCRQFISTKTSMVKPFYWDKNWP